MSLTAHHHPPPLILSSFILSFVLLPPSAFSFTPSIFQQAPPLISHELFPLSWTLPLVATRCFHDYFLTPPQHYRSSPGGISMIILDKGRHHAARIQLFFLTSFCTDFSIWLENWGEGRGKLIAYARWLRQFCSEQNNQLWVYNKFMYLCSGLGELFHEGFDATKLHSCLHFCWFFTGELPNARHTHVLIYTYGITNGQTNI